jgi:signal transduction histidine kinase
MILEAKKIEKAVRETREDAEKATAKAVEEESLRKETQKKLDYVVSQKNFLQKDISDDTKNLESILHHIGLTTSLIRSDIERLVKAINNNIPKGELVNIVKRLSEQNEKITSFSRYFKKVNFNIYSTKLDIDIVSFTNEYLENVYKLRDDLRINRELLDVIIHTPENFEFKIKFNPIDIIIVLDNLISNSSKHGATKVELTWRESNGFAHLSFIDDGKGIADNIIENIFDFGFTTSRRGSGIGLYHTKETLEKLGGSIEVNNKISKGVEFIISFKANK